MPQNMVKKEDVFSIYSLRWQIEILFKTWKSLFGIHEVKNIKKERFECHLYGTLIQLLLCSTLAFQCRRMLYMKHQM
ncbi:transposase, partial [Pallidibacillus thermolactis]|uniref:transposase n=1 Tax=Pallidibacillus thermolactis TaxID=251051 RepID=UPI00399D2A99